MLFIILFIACLYSNRISMAGDLPGGLIVCALMELAVELSILAHVIK